MTVFTSPSPSRAGPIDLSVLVQDAKTGRVVTDATVLVELTRPSDSLPPIRAAATTAAATNKLLQAAKVEIPAPGRWDVRVLCSIPDSNGKVDVATEVRFTMEAARPLPRWLSVWPWFTWPIVAVLLFAVHRELVARRERGPRCEGTRSKWN